MSASALPFPANETNDIYLQDLASSRESGIYGALIESAKSRGIEYSKIWDLFAFRESFTVHLARFTDGVMRAPASIGSGLRELIAAYTSYQNECGFCTQAHAAAAADLLGDEELVWSALRDLDTCALKPEEKTLLRFCGKVTKDVAHIAIDDIEELLVAGWNDEAIYYAITVCSLFNFYNRWITATGVPEMSFAAHRLQGQGIARHGYLRGDEARREEK